MITNLFINGIEFLDGILTSLHLFSYLSDLLVKLNEYQNYITEFQRYLSGAYYIFGKPLVIYVLSCSAIVFGIKLVGAIVFIVGQFVP